MKRGSRRTKGAVLEVLKVLEDEGLICIIKNKGAFVSQSAPVSGTQRIPFVSTSPLDGLIHQVFMGLIIRH